MISLSSVPRPTVILIVLGAAAFLLFVEGAAWLHLGLTATLWIAALAFFVRSRRARGAE